MCGGALLMGYALYVQAQTLAKVRCLEAFATEYGPRDAPGADLCHLVHPQEEEEKEAKAQELRDKAAARKQASSSAGGRTAANGESAAAAAVPVSSPRLQDRRQSSSNGHPQLQQPTSPTGDVPETCANCSAHASATHRLSICTRCRAARYCSEKCQRAAWPAHKAACAAAAKARTSQTGSNPDHAPQLDPALHPRGSDGSGSGGSDDLKEEDVLSALGGLIQRHADARADPLQKQFESAIVQFVRGSYRPAVSALQDVAARAAREQRPDLAGDALRWLGHAHNRLGAPARAAAAFAEGAAIGVKIGSKKLQVDCLSGLGVTHRGQNQTDAAVGYLRQALAVAESMEGGGGPARASVLTNLGSALMSVNVGEAAEMLEEAVSMREQQVRWRASRVGGLYVGRRGRRA